MKCTKCWSANQRRVEIAKIRRTVFSHIIIVSTETPVPFMPLLSRGSGSNSSGEVSLLLFMGSDLHRIYELVVIADGRPIHLKPNFQQECDDWLHIYPAC